MGQDFNGNEWADFFAQCGARRHKLPDTLLAAYKQKLSDAKSEAALMAWQTAAVGTHMKEAEEMVPVTARRRATVGLVQLVRGGRHDLVREGAAWSCCL